MFKIERKTTIPKSIRIKTTELKITLDNCILSTIKSFYNSFSKSSTDMIETPNSLALSDFDPDPGPATK